MKYSRIFASRLQRPDLLDTLTLSAVEAVPPRSRFADMKGVGFQIVRAVAIPEEIGADLRPFEVPDGFPILVSWTPTTAAIVEPAAAFLWDRHFPITRLSGLRLKPLPKRYSINTVLAQANDLKDWWMFLDYYNLRWDQVTFEDLVHYRDAMHQCLSPTRHRPYKKKTIRRRQTTVLGLYRWALSERRISTSENAFLESVRLGAPLPGSFAGRKKRPSNVLQSIDSGFDDEVRALTPRQYQKIASELGPLPSESVRPGVLSRNRLASELSVQTGLRIDEVCGVKRKMIDNLKAEEGDEFGVQLVTISRTKGLRPRTIEIPNWLVRELKDYIADERAEALQEGLGRGLAEEPEELFLNSSQASHNAGKPLTPDTLDDVFRSAVIRAGFVKEVALTDPKTDLTRMVKVNRYSFHCLRHTFAIWRYDAERQSGNSEPWKIIQTLLGHADVSTTQNLYLRLSLEYESQVSDRVNTVLRSMRRYAQQ